MSHVPAKLYNYDLLWSEPSDCGDQYNITVMRKKEKEEENTKLASERLCFGLFCSACESNHDRLCDRYFEEVKDSSHFHCAAIKCQSPIAIQQ